MMHPQMTRCKRTTIGDLCKRPMIGQPLGGAGIDIDIHIYIDLKKYIYILGYLTTLV